MVVATASLLAISCSSAGAPAKEADGASADGAASSASPASTGSADSNGKGAKGKAAADTTDPQAIPDKCETKKNICSPSPRFVKRLCGGYNPDVALMFFRKGTPFTRGYLKGDTNAWNASGGSSSADKLVFDEEVIVLLARESNAGGIEVSGATGGFDVLRWDGSCATLSGEEMTFTTPPKAKNAKITFKDLGDLSQQALLKDDKIAKINADRRKECKGVSMGEVSAKCVKLVDQLSDAVADYVRNGGDIPPPSKLP